MKDLRDLKDLLPLKEGGEACLLIRKHDHYTPARKTRRDVRALTSRNRPKGVLMSVTVQEFRVQKL